MRSMGEIEPRRGGAPSRWSVQAALSRRGEEVRLESSVSDGVSRTTNLHKLELSKTEKKLYGLSESRLGSRHCGLPSLAAGCCYSRTPCSWAAAGGCLMYLSDGGGGVSLPCQMWGRRQAAAWRRGTSMEGQSKRLVELLGFKDFAKS
ncbi:hypothetical protein EJB05_19635, partial [Eragrostis curvula]